VTLTSSLIILQVGLLLKKKRILTDLRITDYADADSDTVKIFSFPPTFSKAQLRHASIRPLGFLHSYAKKKKSLALSGGKKFT
jgi:hypothetical protein